MDAVMDRFKAVGARGVLGGLGVVTEPLPVVYISEHVEDLVLYARILGLYHPSNYQSKYTL